MGTFPLALLPKATLGYGVQCAWAPEPVFTLEESARLLGILPESIRRSRRRYPSIKGEDGSSSPFWGLRRRFPEVKLAPKVCDGLSHTFGPTLSQFGEVTISLDTAGGPQEHVCLTHYGLFRHAAYIRTPQARRFVLCYPEFLCAITTGRVRPPLKTARQYQWALSAPPRQLTARVSYVAAESGLSRKTIWGHLAKVRSGCVDRNGMPRRIKPGPPKAFRLRFHPASLYIRTSVGDSKFGRLL